MEFGEDQNTGSSLDYETPQDVPIYMNAPDDSSLIEEEVGLQLSHLLALGGGAVFVLMLISIMWNYCADEEHAPKQPTKESEKTEQVVVAEVRPGLILIRGSPNSEETLRIVQEYDALSNNSRVPPPPHASDSAYFYGAAQGGVAPQARGTPAYGAAAAPHLHQGESQLIDFDGEVRPPPYAPPGIPYNAQTQS